MNRKKALDDKIKELEHKLSRLTAELDPEKEQHKKYVIGSSPIGIDKGDTIREVVKAKRNSEQRAGLIKNSDDGSVMGEDDYQPDRIPSESIHEFENLEVCICECHTRKKRDCMNCYDHPTHLENKRKPTNKKIDLHLEGCSDVVKDEYDEDKIIELIEADKAKKDKKSWLKRLLEK